jgi:hypothetical protein
MGEEAFLAVAVLAPADPHDGAASPSDDSGRGVGGRGLRRICLALSAAGLLGFAPASVAQVCNQVQFLDFSSGGNTTGPAPGICESWGRCVEPIVGAPVYGLTDPECDPLSGLTCGATAHLSVEWPRATDSTQP